MHTYRLRQSLQAYASLLLALIPLTLAGYTVTILGEEEALHSESLRNQLPVANSSSSVAETRYMRQVVLPAIDEYFRSEGYLNCSVYLKGETEIEVEPGPLYLLDDTLISPPEYQTYVDSLSPLAPGVPLVAREILAALDSLEEQIQTHPGVISFTLVHRLHPDENRSRAKLEADLQNLEMGLFGLTEIRGLRTVSERFVRQHISWHEQDNYSAEKVRQVRQRLIDTALFSLVTIYHRDQATIIELRERPHKSVRVEAWGTSDENLGITAMWKNHYFNERGYRAHLLGELSLRWQKLQGELLIPSPTIGARQLRLGSKVFRESIDAYRLHGWSLYFTWEKPLSEVWTLAYGPEFTIQKSENAQQEDTFATVEWASTLTRDSRDHKFNPSRGSFAQFKSVSLLDVFRPNQVYLKLESDLRKFVALAPFLTFATRVHFGAICGGSINETPKNLRFYAGGSSSIRGYEYKTVSDLQNETPIGGQAQVDAAVELRQKLTDSIGIAYFLDCGYASSKGFGHAVQHLKWSTGIGFRYLTVIAPIRFDLAIPLSRRSHDACLKFYIGIGESF